MWPEDYDTEEEYLDSLKKEDHYHFTVPFTYIKKKLGDDQYEDGTAIMEVDVDWDSFQHGYVITHHCPDMHLIDPAEGNGTADDYWNEVVIDDVWERLASLDIGSQAIYSDS